MAAGVMARVPAVIALIEDEYFAISHEVAPEWKIRVDCKPVAMRQDQPRSRHVSMPAYAHDRTIGHSYVESGDRIREAKFHSQDIFSQSFGGSRDAVTLIDVVFREFAARFIRDDGFRAALRRRSVAAGARRLDDDRLFVAYKYA
jgi:hypothetical protein